MTAKDVSVAAPEAEGELAGVGFFGSRYERATPANAVMRAMATLGDDPVPDVGGRQELSRKPYQPAHRP